MSYPHIAGIANGVQTSDSTTWTASYPGDVRNGDLVLLVVSSDGTGRASASGFTEALYSSQGATVACTILRDSADGTEAGQSISLTIDAAEQGAWRCITVRGLNIARLLDVSLVGGLDTHPTSGGFSFQSQDILSLVFAAADASATLVSIPASYTDTTPTGGDVSGGANGSSLFVAYRQVTTGSENPGQWTISSSVNWVAGTYIIHTLPGNPPPIVVGSMTALQGRL